MANALLKSLAAIQSCDLRRSFIVTAAVAVALGFVLFAVHRYGAWPSPENPPRQGEALDHDAYAAGRIVHSQEALSRAIREPFNTWTNLAFVFVGALLMGPGATGAIAVRRQAGLALIAVGIGSFLYHASASRTLRHLDVGAMYWIYLVLAVLSLGVFSRPFTVFFAQTHRIWMLFIPCIAISITIYRNVRLGGWKPFDLPLVTGVAAALAAVAMLQSARRLGGWLFTASALLLFGVSVALQIGDRPGGFLCNPAGMLQAHGMWHVLGAIACGMTCTQLVRGWNHAPNTRRTHERDEIVDRIAMN